MRILAHLALVAATMAFAHTAGAATVGEPAPAFTLPTASGEEISLADHRGKLVVLEWINFDCPFVKKHYGSGTMPALQQEWIGQGVVWISICSSAPGKQGHFEGDALISRLADEGWAGSAYAIDATGEVGKAYAATNTPHMYVIDAEGVVRYAGAIDSIRSANPDDISQADPYVVDALSALAAGEAVATAETKAYGCSIKYP